MTATIQAITAGPIDKYGTPNGRYGRITVTDRAHQKLWEFRNPANLDADGHCGPGTWAWGKSSPVENGSVKVGDLVAIFNSRDPGYLSCSVGNRINTTTRREVAAVLRGEDGTLRIKARKVGGTGNGGYRQYSTYEFAIFP